MLNQPRFILFRRLLLPCSGEEPLTRTQARRVVATWALLFPLALSIASVLTILIIKAVSLQELALIFLFTFLTSVIIFGAMACFVVIMVNRSARFLQQQRRNS